MKASDRQEGGQHYKDFPIQPAEFCQRNLLNWCESNVVKYVARHRDKKGAEDIRKAIHYLELLLEWEYSQEGEAAAISGVKRVKEPPAGYLCHSCQRNVPFKCHGEYLMTKDGGCEGYISAFRENMLDAKQGINLCTTCGVKDCEAADAWRNICSLYVAKQEAPTAAVLPSTYTDPSTNCKDCHNAACVGKGRNLTCDQGCERFIPKELAQ